MKIPNAWSTSASPVTAAAAVEQTQVKAAAHLDLSADVAGQGLCPECKQPMETVVVDGADVLACMSDRIVLPIKDPEQPAEV